ncbi:MAG: APC family permease, partial [Anaerovoracaceae bacterium]
MSEERIKDEPKKQGELKRVLSLKYLIFFGLAYLVPTSVFNNYGIVTELTKGMMTLAYIITTLAVILTAYSYGKMSTAFPVAGSVYTYVQRSINPHLGFLVGWAMILDYLLCPMISYLFFGLYMNEFVPSVSVQVWVIIAIVVVSTINIIGIEVAAKVNFVITILTTGFVILFIVVGAKFLVEGGGAGTLASMDAIINPELLVLRNIGFGAAILTVGFMGFDAITLLSEEALKPKKDIPRALIITCALAGVLFILTSYISQLDWPNAWKEMENPDTGAFEMLGRIRAAFMPTLFLTVDCFANIVCAIAAQAAVARMLYAMGRDGTLPKKAFGYLSPKFNTPVINILISALIGATAIFYADNLIGAASLISFGALVGFTFVNMSVIAYYFVKKKERKGFNTIKHLVIPGLAMSVSIVLWFSL